MKRIIFLKIHVDGNIDMKASTQRKIAQLTEKWKRTEQGQYVLAHSSDVEVYTEFDFARYETVVAIVGSLPEKYATFYHLKWPDPDPDVTAEVASLLVAGR